MIRCALRNGAEGDRDGLASLASRTDFVQASGDLSLPACSVGLAPCDHQNIHHGLDVRRSYLAFKTTISALLLSPLRRRRLVTIHRQN